MIKKIVPMLCIFLGILVLLYPTLNDRYESYRQQKIMKQWTENLKQIDTAPETAAANLSPAAAVPLSTNAGAVELGPQLLRAETEPPQEPTQGQTQQSSLPGHVEGVLIIDKIRLKLPILTDATVDNLKLSVASIANTGKAGAVGNYAIAGHRNLTYGKNFNRLDEVEIGDRIEVDTGTQQYWYQVQEKLYVLPEEVWVLKGNGRDKEITLITCHPMQNPTHRLVIKGKLVEK